MPIVNRAVPNIVVTLTVPQKTAIIIFKISRTLFSYSAIIMQPFRVLLIEITAIGSIAFCCLIQEVRVLQSGHAPKVHQKSLIQEQAREYHHWLQSIH